MSRGEEGSNEGQGAGAVGTPRGTHSDPGPAPSSQRLDLKTNKKPIMFLFTQPGCSACEALKETLARAPRATAALSKMFAVVHVDGDSIAHSAFQATWPGVAPNGHYVPRAIFANPDGALRPDLAAPGGDPEYPHYYASVAQVCGRERGGRGGGKARASRVLRPASATRTPLHSWSAACVAP